MDDQMTQAYEMPQIVDYGDLQELTASCVGGGGGDVEVPGGFLGGKSVGTSNPAHGAGCKSAPAP
jgi:hypothetical protein